MAVSTLTSQCPCICSCALLLIHNVSLAEVTMVILCGCLPIMPKFFQLFQKTRRLQGPPNQLLKGKGASKQNWSKRTNLAIPPSIPKTRAAQGNLNDSDLHLNGSYIPLVDQCSTKSLTTNVPKVFVDLGKWKWIRKTTNVGTNTFPRSEAGVRGFQTRGAFM